MGKVKSVSRRLSDKILPAWGAMPRILGLILLRKPY